MAHSRMEENWRHTASILTLMFNINRDPRKGNPAKPSDFYPFSENGKAASILVDRKEAADIFREIARQMK